MEKQREGRPFGSVRQPVATDPDANDVDPPKAAKDFEKIAYADSRIEDSQKKAAESDKEAATSQEGLMATLALINPALAEMASRLLRATQAVGTFGKRNISLQRIVKATTAATAVFFLVQQSTRLNREIESAIANLRRFMDNVNRSLASDEQLEGAQEAVDSILGFLFDLFKKGVQFQPR